MTHPIVQRVCTGEFGFDVGVLGGRAQDVEPGCGHGHPRFSSDSPPSATDSTGADDDSTGLASSLFASSATGGAGWPALAKQLIASSTSPKCNSSSRLSKRSSTAISLSSVFRVILACRRLLNWLVSRRRFRPFLCLPRP